MHLHPAVVMVVLIVGSEVAGIWGMVVAVPLAGVAKDVFLYFLNEWKIEEVAPPVDAAGEAANA